MDHVRLGDFSRAGLTVGELELAVVLHDRLLFWSQISYFSWICPFARD